MERLTSRLTRVLIVALLLTAAVTTASSQEQPRVMDPAVVARGEALANEDPLAMELRNQQPNDYARRGFDIGMAIAEGQTLPGPGKDRICASLNSAESDGCRIGVLFSVDRNRNAKLASVGAAIAQANPGVAAIRNGSRDVFFRLGFDIATGIFGDPAQGALGNTLTGPGSLGIRDALNRTGQRGFNASVGYHLGRTNDQTPETRPRTPAETTTPEGSGARGGPLERKRDPGRSTAPFQPENTIKVSVRYKKEFGYVSDSNAFGYVGPTSCSAFSVSVVIGDGSTQRLNPTRVSSDSKMEDTGGFYICNYLLSDIPFNQPTRVSVSMSGRDQSGAWKGGSHVQPAPGQQRTIIIVSGREGDPLVLTATRPRARQLWEMVYTSQPR
jgi:hypothetical protein